MKLKIDIPGAVRTAIARAASVPIERVTNDARLRDDLGMDSLDELEAVIFIEKALPIETIPDGAMDGINTVGDLIDYIGSRPIAIRDETND